MAPIGEVTILYQDSNFLLIHTARTDYSPTQHLFRIDGMYTIVSELDKNQMQWKHWSLWDTKLYWSTHEIEEIETKKNLLAQFGSEYYEAVSTWIAEILILRGEMNEHF